MRNMLKAVLVAALLVPAVSEAQVKLGLGLGLGLGLPMGDYQEGLAMSKLYSAEFPIDLDVSYELGHHVAVGAYAGYAFSTLSSGNLDFDGERVAANDLFDSVRTVRVGLQAEYGFAPRGHVEPWLALRTGYVRETANVSDAFGGGSETVTGWEWLTALAGADYEISERLGIGGFVSLALGEYTKVEDEEFEDPSMHQWVTVGIRGTFDL